MNRNWSAPSQLSNRGATGQLPANSTTVGQAEYVPAISGFTAGWNDPPKVTPPVGLVMGAHLQRPSSVTPQVTPLSNPLPVVHENIPGPVNPVSQGGSVNVMHHAASQPNASAVSNTFVPNGVIGSDRIDGGVSLDQLDDSMGQDVLLQRINQHVNGIQGAARTNIERRLPRLRAALDSDRSLSDACRRDLSRLVSAIDMRAFDLAYSIHTSMMLQYYSEVNQWMVAVKAIVLELKKANKQL